MKTFTFWIGSEIIATSTVETEEKARQEIRDFATIYVNRPFETPYEFLGKLNRSVAKVYE